MNSLIKTILTKLIYLNVEYLFDGKYLYNKQGLAVGYKTKKKGFKLYTKKNK